MRLWCRAGFAEPDFWLSTPGIIETVLGGYHDRTAAEQDGRAWLAFHVGVMMRAATPPTYDALLGRPTVPQSEDDLHFNLTAFAAATQVTGG